MRRRVVVAAVVVVAVAVVVAGWLVVTGPDGHRAPVAGVRAGRGDRELVVVLPSSACARPDRVTVGDEPDRVLVDAYCTGRTGDGAEHHVFVRLSAPLGDRVVVDGGTGTAIPRTDS